MSKLLQINPVLRVNTSTGRIMQEIGEMVMTKGWKSYVAYSQGRDGLRPCQSELVPMGTKTSVALHGLATRLLDRHGLASNRATHQFIRQIEEIKPDIIHIHNIHGYFLNYKILFEYLHQCGTPVVWTVHDCWLYTGHCYYYSYVGCDRWQTECHDCPQRGDFPRSLFVDRSRQNFKDKRAAFTSIPKDMMTIVPVSDWIAGEMRHSFLRDYPFRVIHNGIDTEVFSPCDTESVRARYSLRAKCVLIGVASIWSKEKGFDDFLRLASLLNNDERLILVGVSDRDKRRLPSNVVGISRTENVRQLAELYSAATAFVNLTYQDNYPTVNLEAIACGTPVVTYRTGGSVEAVTKETGFVVPQGDVIAALQAVRTIEQRGKQAYAIPCRQYALAHFRKQDCYADYLHLYDELIAETRR